jgi:hypothetical protein
MANPGPSVDGPIFFLDRIRGLSGDEGGLDVLYEEIDGMLRSGDFPRVGEILGQVGLDLPVVYLLGFISITRTAREKLPGWGAFYARVKAHLQATEPDRWVDLLRGFE